MARSRAARQRPHGIGRTRPPLHPTRALALPLAFTTALAAMSRLPAVHGQRMLAWSILGAAGILLLALAVLRLRANGRTFAIDVQLRPQHYLQACAQGTVLLYWGYYWPPVYAAIPLIVAQLLFAYAFDMLLAWSRRDTYTLGFAPFPVIFSINLFLWFRADWFYLQFLMIAVGFAAKDLIRWERDGRRTHIFNPSSFPLGVFSIGLLLTGTTSMTWGVEIARTQFNPPHIYVLLFLIGLPGQLLFGVTTMTMSAVLTTYGFGLAYFALTGTYFFIDSYIPVAVFLGMHLLFTDPSTSPRTEIGRIVFGVIYGLSNVVLYAVLGRLGLPTFYDKLLPVPLMNLSVRFIDRMAPRMLHALNPARLGAALAPRRRNLMYVTVWTAAFVSMSAAEGVGDHHPGHAVPFWQRACAENRHDACATLGQIADIYCQDGSGWACNEAGVLRAEGRVDPAETAAARFAHACSLGNAIGCQNSVRPAGVAPRRSSPRLADYPVVLRYGKGPLPDRTPFELHTRACGQGWLDGCEGVAIAHLRGDGVPRDPGKAAEFFETACRGGLPTGCANVGFMYYSADGVPKDEARGVAHLRQACDMGHPDACRWLADVRPAAVPAAERVPLQ